MILIDYFYCIFDGFLNIITMILLIFVWIFVWTYLSQEQLLNFDTLRYIEQGNKYHVTQRSITKTMYIILTDRHCNSCEIASLV